MTDRVYAEMLAERIAAKREKNDFAALVNRLRVRNWANEVRAEGGARLEKMRAVKRAHYQRNRDEYRRKAREKSRRAPRSAKCDVCGNVFALPYPHPRGSVRKRCSLECDRVALNRQARKDQSAKRRAEGQRVLSCTKCGEPGHNRRTCHRSEAA